MNAAVCRIGEPKFLFIRGQSDAMAWTPVALSQTFLVARNLDTVEHLPGLEVPDFEAEKLVHVDKAERLTPVDGKRADRVAERSNLIHNRMGFGIRHRKEMRLQTRKIDARAIGAVNRVMRARLGFNPGDDIAGQGINDMPMRPLE